MGYFPLSAMRVAHTIRIRPIQEDSMATKADYTESTAIAKITTALG